MEQYAGICACYTCLRECHEAHRIDSDDINEISEAHQIDDVDKSDSPPLLCAATVSLQRPIIFLDVDGVLNTYTLVPPDEDIWESPGHEATADLGFVLSRARLALLAKLVHDHGCRVVLSTAWRVEPAARAALSTAFAEHGLPLETIIGATPELRGQPRALEIARWLDSHPDLVCKEEGCWIAIDDIDLAAQCPSLLEAHFVHTSIARGLTPDGVAFADALLQRHAGRGAPALSAGSDATTTAADSMSSLAVAGTKVADAEDAKAEAVKAAAKAVEAGTGSFPSELHSLSRQEAWRSLRESGRCRFEQLDLAPFRQSLRPSRAASGQVRFVCISDTHGKHHGLGELPQGDVLVHSGDFTQFGRLCEISNFCKWLSAQPHARKIIIAGNHELPLHPSSFERTADEWSLGESERLPATCDAARALLASIPNCDYLLDSGTVVGGLEVWGAPWQPVFGGAFNLARGPCLAAKWALIPESVDVLLTHGPPLGHGDMLKTGKRHEGCLDLLEAVSTRQQPPRYHVFGHIHEGYGVSTNGVTTFVNASSSTRRGACTNEPIVFDVDCTRAPVETRQASANTVAG